MHGPARAVFGVAVLAALAVMTAATFAAITPKPVAIAPARDIAIAKLDSLPDGIPVATVVPELKGLNLVADRRREASFPRMATRPTRDGDLAVWLVRSDGAVRAFIALDPRNGCRLDTLKVAHDSRQPPSITVFYDVCHGSLYDLGGDHVGGPSPWTLDQLVLTVRDGVVYADLHDVIPGRYIYPR